MSNEKHTPGPWIAKYYPPKKEGDRPTWGVRQDPNAPSMAIMNEDHSINSILPCGFSICEIVEQDMEDIENGIEAANARLIAAAPQTLIERDALLEIAALALNWWHADDANFDNDEPDFIKLAHKCDIARELAMSKNQLRKENK